MPSITMSICTVSSTSRLIDYGATSHMTPQSHPLTFYEPCPSAHKVIIAFGTSLTATNVGGAQLPTLHPLTNVLYIIDLFVNLISLHKLIQDLGYNITFFEIVCFYCHKVLGQTITLAKVKGSLYVALDSLHALVVDASPSSPQTSTSSTPTIWLHHRHLGHPSFTILKIMFPQLFCGVDAKFFVYDLYHLAKHY